MQEAIEELAGKRLLVLGGSDWKAEIRSFCAEHAITVVAAGNDPSSGISKIADEYYNVDSTDEEKMKKLIKEKRIDGIFSCASEAVIPHSIHYAIESGLYSYATEEQWMALMNKKNMKAICSRYGLDIIPEYTLEDVRKKTVTYPVIVKPADSSGSRGITVCENEAELIKAIDCAKAASVTNDLLIEQFITAPFWQMEIYMQDGTPYMGFSKERVFYPSIEGKAKQPFMDIYPSRYDERIRRDVFPKFSRAVSDLGVKNASIWVQGFITETKAYVFDVGFRLGGGMENRIMAREKGVDNIQSHIAFALTGKWIGDYSSCRMPFGEQYRTVCVGLKNGTIGKIDGLEQLRNNPYIFDVIQYYDIGNTVTKSGLYKQSLFRFFLKGYPYSSEELIQMIYGTLRVCDSKGNDMLLPTNHLEWDNELSL